MKKRILEKMPDILATKAYLTMAKEDKPVIETRGHYSRYQVKTYKWNVYIKAKLFETKDEEILKVALYDRKDLCEGHTKAKYTIYISKDNREFITWDTKERKWRESMIDKLSFNEYAYEETKKYCDKQSEKLIIGYLQGIKKTAFAAIHEFQLEIRKEVLTKYHKSITDRIDLKMELVPEPPTDLEKFINDKALLHSRYIIYDYSRDVKEGYCTHCKQMVPIESPKHLKEGTCKNCHSKIKFIARKKSANIHDTADASVLQRTNEGFILRFYKCNKTYRKESFERPKLSYFEFERIFYDDYFNQGEVFWWEEFKSTGVIRWVDERNSSVYGYGGCSGGSSLYEKNLSRTLKETELKYSAIEIMAKNVSFNVIQFIAEYKRKKYIEALIKVGLFNLVKDLIKDYWGRDEINPFEKKLKNMLGLNKENIAMLKKINGGTRELKILQKVQKQGIRLTINQIEWTRENDYHGELIEYTEFATMHKIIKYVNSISKNEKSDWIDYLRWCQELEYDLHNEFIIFPKPFKQAHDRVLEENNKRKDKERLKKLAKESKVIKKMAAEVLKQYGIETDDLIILVPKNAKEIIDEGHTLHHCVGTYVEKVAAGTTNILFIRDKKNIKKPFYTLEVRDNIVIQCRGKNNCNMTKEVEEFVELLKRKRLKREKVAS